MKRWLTTKISLLPIGIIHELQGVRHAPLDMKKEGARKQSREVLHERRKQVICDKLTTNGKSVG